MKIVFVAIILIMMILNFACFLKSKKYLKNVQGEDEESTKNYEAGMKYIKISVVLSLFTCFVGITAILIYKFL
jgi:NADH:ubiquinone oxidoreductase subunit 3 (subunit A)